MHDKYLNINENDRYVNFCKKHLSTNSLKVHFDQDVVLANPNKNLLRKVISSIKYYCWNKWIAWFADCFSTKKENINPNLDVGLDEKKENIEAVESPDQDKNRNIVQVEHKGSNDQKAF